MFRTSIVHLQERSYAVCCNLVCLDTSCCYENCSSSFTLITTGHTKFATYSIRTLLKMDYWSPKHVELLNVMNKINHQILCILLDYEYIAKWSTVHTISNPSRITSTTTLRQPTASQDLQSYFECAGTDISRKTEYDSSVIFITECPERSRVFVHFPENISY